MHVIVGRSSVCHRRSITFSNILHRSHPHAVVAARHVSQNSNHRRQRSASLIRTLLLSQSSISPFTYLHSHNTNNNNMESNTNNSHNKRKFVNSSATVTTTNETHKDQKEEEKARVLHEDTTSATVATDNMIQKDNAIVTRKPLIVVIAGPTGSGKSDVAALLCSSDRATRILQETIFSLSKQKQQQQQWRGHIISADSVQAYQGVNVGANKPTYEEREITPYHLIDVINSANGQYNAADWMSDAVSIIEDLSAASWKHMTITKNNNDPCSSPLNDPTTKDDDDDDGATANTTPVLPIVVGGTMMYLQWLVHGRPDAPKPSVDDVNKATRMIQEYQEVGDDLGWRAAVDKVSSFGSVFQARAEKLCGRDWYRLRRLIEVALAAPTATGDDMTTSSTADTSSISSYYTGERMGGLSTLGYDVRSFFLCPNDRMKHAHILDERCEQMVVRGLLEETVNLAISGQLPPDSQVARAIGYRQVLTYLNRTNPKANDVEAFEHFLNDFTAATRQYSKKQMQWFRRDNECVFVPVETTATKQKRIQDAAEIIMKLCLFSRTDYDAEISDVSLSSKTKNRNEDQAKGMRVFLGQRHIFLKGSDALKQIVQVADQCTARMNGVDTLLATC